MRKLSIDGLPLLFSGGISNYVTPLAQNLLRKGGRQWIIELVFRLGVSRNRWRHFRRYRGQNSANGGNYRWTPLPDRITGAMWENGVPMPFLLKDKSDSVFISTTEMIPKMKKGLVGWIVYDFTPFHLSGIFSTDKAAYLATAAERAGRTDFIIAISESTKKDVVDLIGYPEDRVCVVYPGVGEGRKAAATDVASKKGRRPYIYYLGSLSLSKNVDGMLRIFARIVHEYNIDLDIVLTGKDFCGEAFWQSLITDLNIQNRVHFTGWISDHHRDHLLRRAKMLWQFSWYEGFGLPVLEAASCGIPVMHSNRGSLPEIVRNPEQAINPDDEIEAAARAAAALSSPETLSRWKQTGLTRASEFSWEKSVKKLLNWMNTVL